MKIGIDLDNTIINYDKAFNVASLAVLNKKFYHVKEKGNVKNKIIKQLENLINRTQK